MYLRKLLRENRLVGVSKKNKKKKIELILYLAVNSVL